MDFDLIKRIYAILVLIAILALCNINNKKSLICYVYGFAAWGVLGLVFMVLWALP